MRRVWKTKCSSFGKCNFSLRTLIMLSSCGLDRLSRWDRPCDELCNCNRNCTLCCNANCNVANCSNINCNGS